MFVSGALQREVEKTLSVGLDGDEKRVLLINGERVPLAATSARMTVFAYSAARLEILRGAPEERRRFLDRGIASIDPGYLEQVSRYARVLRAAQRAPAERHRPAASMRGIRELIETAARAPAGARDVRAVAAAGVRAHRRRAPLPRRQPARWSTARSSVENLRAMRGAEQRARMSLAGPQRDLLDFTVDGRAAAEVLSGGEMKMIVLFLKFAKLELFRRRFEEPAIFLLDDVDAELDLEILQKSAWPKCPPKRRFSPPPRSRVFCRSLEAAPHRRLTIENGRVTAAEICEKDAISGYNLAFSRPVRIHRVWLVGRRATLPPHSLT